MKTGKIDRKMHKIKKCSLEEHLFIPSNHFISHFNISVNKLNFLTAKLVSMYIIINLNLHILMTSLTYVCFLHNVT